MSVEVVDTGVRFAVGEGPHWEDDKQSLLFVDCSEGGIFRWFPEGKNLQKIHLGNIIGSMVPCKDGGYLVGSGRTISHIDWETQRITKQLDVESVGTNDNLNDGKCDASGRFWTGTMGTRITTDIPTFEPDVGILYSLDLDGSLNRHLDKLQVSNGMCWSKDNRTMFYTDFSPQKVYAFDFDVDHGTISNQRIAVDLTKPEDGSTMGQPDGMTIDTDDHLWVACFGSGKVICFDPSTGQPIHTVHVPTKRNTSCCFGGKNLDELYITSANIGVPHDELQAYPDSGSLFKVTGLGVKGYPANIYKGKLKNIQI